MTRDEARARLITTYFTAHGPATVGDCAWWSGLPVRDVREGIALAGETLGRREHGGVRCWGRHASRRLRRRPAGRASP